MRDTGFEPGTTAPVVWSATNNPPHLYLQFLNYIIVKKNTVKGLLLGPLTHMRNFAHGLDFTEIFGCVKNCPISWTPWSQFNSTPLKLAVKLNHR